MEPTLESKISQALEDKHLLPESATNIRNLLSSSDNPRYEQVVAELVDAGNWEELNDRFFRLLAFGTGGLRGRTIGKIVTGGERGTPNEMGRPEFPCVGTNAMNFYNLSRANQGLARYIKAWLAKDGREGRGSVVIGHDTRHFSREFAEFSAKVLAENGCDVYLFESARSTPQVSFTIRHLGATAGIILTASHNPFHDNGFKAYFEDGGQVVAPHDKGILTEVNALESESYTPLPAEQQGKITLIGSDLDEAYMARLETLLLQPEMVAAQKDKLKIVFTPLHGTGAVTCVPMLGRLGFQAVVVPEQAEPDGRFPTVKSPNPENADGLQMGVDLAEKEGAALVIGTDPDADRMGALARDGDGKLTLLSGNQIGSILGWYRAKTLLDLGILDESNKRNATFIKTFVTSELQKSIADGLGIRCVNTLTGFKYIGNRLEKYEKAIPAELRADYRNLPEAQTRALRLEHSTYFVFGGEESYGYGGADFVRDKDANGSVVMLAEAAAYAVSRGITLIDLLDEIYCEFGYFQEKNESLMFEGAEGAAKIQKLADSYAANPPTALDSALVTKVTNFSAEEIRDSEGELIPEEKMIIVELEDGRRFAVRPSGTEPKIKYYFFGKALPPKGSKFPPEALVGIKASTSATLNSLWEAVQEDVKARLSR